MGLPASVFWKRGALFTGLALASVAVIQPARAQVTGPPPRSGEYGSMNLAVVGDRVTGTFFDQRGLGPDGAPQFSCIFLLAGRVEGGRAKVETWFPGDAGRIRGELVFKPDGVTLRLEDNQGGCAMTSGDMVHQAYEASRDAEGAGWIGLGLVSAAKARFQPSPGATAPRSPFVVRFDPVVILDRVDEWVRARYLGGGKPVTGWLRAADLTFADPGGARPVRP